jgi:formylglycine-generating enzyme required for sulfatase activity
MRFIPIRAGSFLMGSPDDEPGRFPDEGPRHRVTITRPFYLGVTPVTQEQYRAVTGKNPARFKGRAGGGRDLPVETVSWQDAIDFLTALSERPEEKAAGRVYRLPTEAEWEYACRAGTKTAYHFDDAISGQLADYDWSSHGAGRVRRLYPEMTSPVRNSQENAWGLSDMHGNVREWCQDAYDVGFYAEGPENDPVCRSGGARVLRGGSWRDGPRDCRATSRHHLAPGSRADSVGFRAVCELRQVTPTGTAANPG